MITKLALKSHDGHYLCADDLLSLVANRTARGAWETFGLTQMPDGRVALKSAFGYLCASLGGGSAMEVNRTAIGPWEQFIIIGDLKAGGKIGLLTWDTKHYVCAEGGGGGVVNATRTSMGVWETFEVEVVEETAARPEPISIDRTRFVRPDGSTYKSHAVMDWRMFGDFLAGKDLSWRFKWARALGVTGFRTTLALSWTHLSPAFIVDPRRYPVSQVRQFTELCLNEGFQNILVVLADCEGSRDGYQKLGLSEAFQRQWVRAVHNELHDLPGQFVICNEPFVNGCDPTRVYDASVKGPHHLVDLGVYVNDWRTEFTIPFADYTGPHTERSEDWEKTAKAMLEYARLGWTAEENGVVLGEFKALGVPSIGDEGTPIGSTTISGKNDSRPQRHADYAAVADIMASGMTAFSRMVGNDGVPPSDEEQACYEAIATVWRDVAALGLGKFQMGTYTRGPLPGCPLEHSDATALRTYVMMDGNAAVGVPTRYTGNGPVAINGWRIEKVAGYNGNLVLLAR
jgi:hypothetical protein